MIAKDKRRLLIIADLLAMARPLKDIANELAEFNWDYEGDGIELRPQHLCSVLEHFLEGKLTATEIEEWANLIEMREDVAVKGVAKKKMEDVLHELANPLLTQPLDRIRAREIFDALVI